MTSEGACTRTVMEADSPPALPIREGAVTFQELSIWTIARPLQTDMLFLKNIQGRIGGIRHLQSLSYGDVHVFRFTNEEVLYDTDYVISQIESYFNE